MAGRDFSSVLFGSEPAAPVRVKGGGRDLSAELFGATTAEPSMLSSIKQGIGNLAAGAVRGAGALHPGLSAGVSGPGVGLVLLVLAELGLAVVGGFGFARWRR